MGIDRPLEVLLRLIETSKDVSEKRQVSPHRTIRGPRGAADDELGTERAKRFVQDLRGGDASHASRHLGHERRHHDPHAASAERGHGARSR